MLLKTYHRLNETPMRFIGEPSNIMKNFTATASNGATSAPRTNRLVATSVMVALCAGSLLQGQAHALTLTPDAKGTILGTTGFPSTTGGSIQSPLETLVGSLLGKEQRTVAEFDIKGLKPVKKATLGLRVSGLVALLGGINLGAEAYVGNNVLNLSDYQAPTVGSQLLNVNLSGLLSSSEVTVDVTALLNAAIARGDASLGIRLRPLSNPGLNLGLTLDNINIGTVANDAPTVNNVSIKSTTSTPTTNGTLSVDVSTADSGQGTITYKYVWKKNGVVIPNETGATLDLGKPGNGDKGDVITVTVTANNGTSDSDPVTSPPITIGNSLPTLSGVSIKSSTTTPSTNGTLSVNATAADADNDSLTYKYVWKKNGVVIPNETGATLNLSKAGNGDKGDKITVTVTLNDGSADSTPITSAAITIGNSTPTLSGVTIKSSTATPVTNSVLSVNATASDPDQDTLTYKYVWKKNGAVIPNETGATLNLGKAGNGDKNDKITVTVTLNDGTADSSPVTSPAVTIANSAPVVSGVTITRNGNILTANVTASDADNDPITFTYTWMQGGVVISGQTGPTLDISKLNGNGGPVTVTVTASDGTSSSGNSTPITSPPIVIADDDVNFAPKTVSVTPQAASNKVGDKRTFTITASDANGASDIREMWLLINDRLGWESGATLIYRPSATNPANGTITLRRGDAFLPEIKVGAGASSNAVLDNGAVRVVGSDISVSVSGNNITLTLPMTLRDGLVGENTMYAHVSDTAGASDPAAQAGDQKFVRFGKYTVTPKFSGPVNEAPKLGNLSPGVVNSTLNSAGIDPNTITMVFAGSDADGMGDIESLWFLAGKSRSFANGAVVVYSPRDRRMYLRSDDGNSWLGGIQVGQPNTAGILENSQVRIDLAQVVVTIGGDGKSVALRIPMQAKRGLLGQNTIWLRTVDRQGATPLNGDEQGYIVKGSWNVTQGTATRGLSGGAS